VFFVLSTIHPIPFEIKNNIGKIAIRQPSLANMNVHKCLQQQFASSGSAASFRKCKTANKSTVENGKLKFSYFSDYIDCDDDIDCGDDIANT
jgi:hypothetical protein